MLSLGGLSVHRSCMACDDSLCSYKQTEMSHRKKADLSSKPE